MHTYQTIEEALYDLRTESSGDLPWDYFGCVIVDPSQQELIKDSAEIHARITEYEQRIFHERVCGRTSLNKHGPIPAWQWAELNLKRDRDTREAVIPLTIPRDMYFHKGGALPRCQYIRFHIAGDRLRLTVVYRECDLEEDFAVDLPYFAGLIFRMLAAVASHHPQLQPGSLVVLAERLYTSG